MSTTQVLRASNAPAVAHAHTDSGSSNRLKKGNMSSAVPTTSTKTAAQNVHLKKIPRKSSKPLLTWFQRKLGGSVKAKRSENIPVPIGVGEFGMGRPSQSNSRGSASTSTSPLPQTAQSTVTKQSAKRESGSLARRTTFSTNDDGDSSEYPQPFDDGNSVDCSSYARDSLWSPISAQEADDDASLRPIPPSAPPSPSPSRSSSSYLSDPRTFRSMAASTKPTTILSIDLGTPGMAHIAQVPANAPTNPVHRIAPHIRHSSSLSTPAYLNSGNSITFSGHPSSAQPSSRPNSLLQPGSIGSLNFNPALSPGVPGSSNHVQAPLHTSHHPRNNPRPSSPPMDNASMLTLASSAFAHPGRSGLQAYSITTTVLGDTASHYGESVAFPDGESTSQFHLGDDDRLDERDIDASVRALRPRSSRRGSWESEASRWSARVQNGTGTPSLAKDRSLWTANSIRTGAFSTDYRQDDDDVYDNDKSDVAHDLKMVPSIVTGKEEDSLGYDESSVERQTLEVPVEENARSNLHRPSTETIAQPQTPARSSPDSADQKDTVEVETKAEVKAEGTLEQAEGLGASKL